MRVIEPFPNVGIGVETLEGTVAGTAVLEVAESLRPASVIATTENVYEVPLVRRVMTQVVSPAVAHVRVLPLVVTR